MMFALQIERIRKMSRIKIYFETLIIGFLGLSCASYHLHIKVLPEDHYDVLINNTQKKGQTDLDGQIDLTINKVSLLSRLTVSVKNDRYDGFVTLDPYMGTVDSRNLDSITTQTRNNGRSCNIKFIVDPTLFHEAHPQKSLAIMPVSKENLVENYSDSKTIVSQEYKNKTFSHVSLGILPIMTVDSIYIGIMRYMEQAEIRKKVKENFEKELPKQMADVSSFSKILIFDSIPPESIKNKTMSLKHGRSFQISLPIRDQKAAQPSNMPDFLLCLEIAVAFDDSSLTYVDAGAIASFALFGALGGGGSWVKAKPMEECLHYGCRFAFIDSKTDSIVCYGICSGEGCSTPQERYGPTGVWPISIQELAKRIVNETPFKMKTINAKNFR
jgi:hypothetical protein